MSSRPLCPVTCSTPARQSLRLSLLDLPDDAWYKILSLLSGPDGYDIQFMVSLSMISNRFRGIFLSFASSITEVDTSFFMRFKARRIIFDEYQGMYKMHVARHPISVDEFDLPTLFKNTIALRTIKLAEAIPSVVNEVCIRILLDSAINTLNFVDISGNSIQDHTLKLFLKCRNLQSLLCRNVSNLTGSAFADGDVCAPLRSLDVSDCRDFTIEGLRSIFNLPSVEYLILDDVHVGCEQLRDFIQNDLPRSRLAKTLRYFSLQYSYIYNSDVLIVLRLMPSLTCLILYDPETLYGGFYPPEHQNIYLDEVIIAGFNFLFPKVRIVLNEYPVEYENQLLV